MRTLLLIDLSAVFWWKWHASAGKSIDAAYESTVYKVRQLSLGYDGTTVCCDEGRSFRYALCETYKANRPPRDEIALSQLARVKTELRESGFAMVGIPGYEGDDIIATLCRHAYNNVHVTIAGMDKDLFALCDDSNVQIVHLQTGEVITEQTIKQKMGVFPCQIRDYLALVGDSADNIKGIPKIGPGHAARLLTEYGSIARMWAHIREGGILHPPSIHASFAVRRNELDLALQLVTLNATAPLEKNIYGDGSARPISVKLTPRPEDSQQEEIPMPAPAPRFSPQTVTKQPDRSPHKFILTARSGLGKTWFASTIPDVFIVPVEHGLKGANPDYEPAHFPVHPRTLAEFFQSLDVFMQVNVPGDGGVRPYRHLVIDSLSGLEDLVHLEACGSERVKHMQAKEFNTVWSAAEPLWKDVQRKLDSVRFTQHVHLWIIAHSDDVVEANTATGETFRKMDILMKGTGKALVQAKQIWRQWADHIFFGDWDVQVKKGDKGRRAVGVNKARVLYTQETATHYAKTRSRLPPKLPMEWRDLERAMKSGVAMTDDKMREALFPLLALLPKEQAAEVSEELALNPELTGNKLASLLSRVQGMVAIARDEIPPEEPEEEEAAPAEVAP